jgi:hypothetical protein
VDDHLGVAARAEAVPGRLELGLERLEVVDLAVEDELDGHVLVGQWLVPALEVDDREPPVREDRGAAVAAAQDLLALVVRPAMGEQPRHPQAEAGVLLADVARDPAHG